MARKYRIVQKIYSDNSVVFIPEYKVCFLYPWIYVWVSNFILNNNNEVSPIITKYEDALQVINEWKKEDAPKHKEVKVKVVTQNIYPVE